MPSRDTKRNQYGNYHNQGHGNGRQGGPPRNHVIPTEPPYTAYIGNAPDSMVQGDFENHLFVGLKVKQVRLVRDRQTDRFRGFAYVDFEDEESLRRAIELDGTCINDRSIRIDVAVRPLGGANSEGFRNKPGFDSRNGRRNPSGGNAANRPHDRYRQGNNYNQSETSHNPDGESWNDGNRYSSSKSNRRDEYDHGEAQARKTSNDEVFAAPDTPTSNDEGADHMANAQNETSMVRQQSRNWADCPIEEPAAEPSPPPSVNNTFSGDDFHVVRNRNPKSRGNQQGSSRQTGNQYNRDRNNGNNNRGGPSQMSGGRNHYEQTSSQYANNSQQFYYQQQSSQTNYAGGASFRPNSNNPNRNQESARPRQRLNSNRSNTSRGYNENYGPPKPRTSESSNETNNNSAASENRPRLQLLPRSQKATASTDDNPTTEGKPRNASIFGSGKPRDERDPKLAQLNKHIDEVVEKEQHVATETSDGSGDGVTRPVQILTAAKNLSVNHENTN